MPEARDNQRWAGLLSGGLVLVALQARIRNWMLDDAFITFRYAENLVAGHGPVFNPGEWVEGYTTFLWMALVALGHGLGLPTVLFARALGLLLSLATLGLLVREDSGLDGRTGGLAALFTGTCAVFSVWALAGMEVPLVGFLLTGTLLATLGVLEDRAPGWLVGLCGALALATRPDSVVTVGVCVGALLAFRRRQGLLAAAVVCGLYGPYFLTRWWAYGWLLPNTFYAKVGGTEAQVVRGLSYVGGGLTALAPLLLLALAGLGRLRERPALGLFWAALVAHGAYVALVGGDIMPAYRFLAGLTPALAVLAAVGVGRLGDRAVLGAAAATSVVGIALFFLHPQFVARMDRDVVARNGAEVGRFLADTFPADTLLATNTAGSVPYHSRFRTVDMLGLNDAHIAHREMERMGTGLAGHEKADGAYVFDRDPDIVQFGSARGRVKPLFRSDRQLKRQPGFSERYELRTFDLPSGGRLVLYVRRDWPATASPPP